MKKLVYNPQSTLEEAVDLLDQGGSGFLPVVDSDNKLLGIITDGDLRRALLKKNLELDAIINRNPMVEKSTVPHALIRKKLRAIRRRHMPVVDEQNRLVDVVVLDEFEFSVKENWVVIMAGGLGTRLGELTRNMPKPMLDIKGKPILLRIIEHFRQQGFVRFILCVNYKSEIIEQYFGDGSHLGIEIRYTRESKRLGTAGALSLIDFDLQRPFFVVNGDVLTTINFEDFLNFHHLSGADATMCVKKISNEIPYACIDFDSEMNLVALKEKPVYNYHINTGMYVFNPSVVGLIPYNEYFDMPVFFESLIAQQKKVRVFAIEDYWLDIGRYDDLEKAKS